MKCGLLVELLQDLAQGHAVDFLELEILQHREVDMHKHLKGAPAIAPKLLGVLLLDQLRLKGFETLAGNLRRSLAGVYFARGEEDLHLHVDTEDFAPGIDDSLIGLFGRSRRTCDLDNTFAQQADLTIKVLLFVRLQVLKVRETSFEQTEELCVGGEGDLDRLIGPVRVGFRGAGALGFTHTGIISDTAACAAARAVGPDTAAVRLCDGGITK